MNWNERLYAALEDCDLIRGAKVRRTWESVAGGRIRVDLHFEVTTSSKLLAGEGVPYLIDRYPCMSANGGPIELLGSWPNRASRIGPTPGAAHRLCVGEHAQLGHGRRPRAAIRGSSAQRQLSLRLAPLSLIHVSERPFFVPNPA